MANQKPNVILINCDDMGYGDLGCYGSTCNKTPCIDMLANEGIQLMSCYASSPVCSPSRASLMTGCYPPRLGINRVLFPGEKYGLNKEEYTLPQMFHECGYKTMIVGKWHCGDQKEFLPTAFGFDDYYGLPYSNDMGMQRGREDFTKFPPLPLMANNEVIEEQPDQKSLTERYVEQCTRFIRTSAKGNHPFFLYFAHMHVHLPLYAQDRFVNGSQNGDFGACMEEVDWSCQCLIEELKKNKIYEETLIIFTSDNGSRADHGASNGILRGTKFYTWEGGMRVPCIFHWKGVLQEGIVNDSICSHIDFLPTLAHFLGFSLEGKKTIDGIDLYRTIMKNQDVRTEYAYYGPNRGDERTGYLCAVRQKNWKLHCQRINRNSPGYAIYEPVYELYDLEKDIGESVNLVSEYPDVAERMTKIYGKYMTLLGDESHKIMGEGCRDPGIVENPITLTTYNENFPYIIALYDKDEQG
ncbi:MAG: sulfatase [Lachnospiraceae bacterium]